MGWWVPLVVAGAQMAKGEYDKQQAEKKASSRDSGGSMGTSFPSFDASNYEQGDSSVIREPEMVRQTPERTPYYQPQIGGDIDERLKKLRLLEASRGVEMLPMPEAPALAPPHYQGDRSIFRTPEMRRY